jgi:glycosyltransferase involved in cell wall biosynthesis
VTLLGRTPEAQTRSLLARCDVFMLSSRWEGMPNSLLEAMAFRRPVVVTDVGGCREVVTDGVSGFLVPARHARALAARVCELLANAPRATAMGQAARRRIEEAFTVQSSTRQWLSVYDALFSLAT